MEDTTARANPDLLKMKTFAKVITNCYSVLSTEFLELALEICLNGTIGFNQWLIVL